MYIYNGKKWNQKNTKECDKRQSQLITKLFNHTDSTMHIIQRRTRLVDYHIYNCEI